MGASIARRPFEKRVPRQPRAECVASGAPEGASCPRRRYGTCADVSRRVSAELAQSGGRDGRRASRSMDSHRHQRGWAKRIPIWRARRSRRCANGTTQKRCSTAQPVEVVHDHHRKFQERCRRRHPAPPAPRSAYTSVRRVRCWHIAHAAPLRDLRVFPSETAQCCAVWRAAPWQSVCTSRGRHGRLFTCFLRTASRNSASRSRASRRR